MLPEDTVKIIDGVWLLNADGVPEPAVSPLNKYSSIRKGIGMQQIGPGNSFSEEIHKATGRKILLVVNARGGSSLSEWMKDSPEQDYFEEAVKRAGQAAGYGKIKGHPLETPQWVRYKALKLRAMQQVTHYDTSLKVFVRIRL